MQGLRISSKELSQAGLRQGRNMNIHGAAATQDWLQEQQGKKANLLLCLQPLALA